MIWAALAFIRGSKAAQYVVLALVVVALVVGGGAWLRYDAARDAVDKMEADANAARIEHIEDANERMHDVETLDDAGVLDRLLGRVREADTDD
jgi:formylmethanofuran dehydrogenase subunit B